MEMPINRYQCEWVGIAMQWCTRAISVWNLKKKLSGCASNSLAHEDLGKFEEAHHWNIQAKLYNEKFPLVYESEKIGDSLSWRSRCYFEAQVWKKDSNIVPSPFSLIFFIFFILVGIFGLFFLFGLHLPLLLFIKSGDSSQLVRDS